MKLTLLIKLIVVFLLCGQVKADEDASKLLDHFFSDLKTLSADFIQTVQNAQLNATEYSEGKLWIQRPGQFRWNYEKPYLQEIVSNGEKIWIYDADLEQVTIKKIDKALANTPALLLSNNVALEDSFTIEKLSKRLGLNWIVLYPKNVDAGFSSIRLGFDKTARLAEMQLEDNLGQSTHMMFSNVVRNVVIDPNVFQFIPPKNIDVFESQ